MVPGAQGDLGKGAGLPFKCVMETSSLFFDNSQKTESSQLIYMHYDKNVCDLFVILKVFVS